MKNVLAEMHHIFWERKGPTFMAFQRMTGYEMSRLGHESQSKCILSAGDVFPFLL